MPYLTAVDIISSSSDENPDQSENLRLEGDSRLNFGDKHVKDTQKLF